MNEVIIFIILISGLILGGLVSFFFAFKILLYYRLINDTPTSKIRSMAMGFVEVKGKVKTKEILKSPFSNSLLKSIKDMFLTLKMELELIILGTLLVKERE